MDLIKRCSQVSLLAAIASLVWYWPILLLVYCGVCYFLACLAIAERPVGESRRTITICFLCFPMIILALLVEMGSKWRQSD